MKLKQVIFENDIETKQGDWFADLAMDIITEVKDGFEKLFSTDTDIQKYSSLNRVEINYIPGEFTKPEENFFKLRETVDVAVPGLGAAANLDMKLNYIRLSSSSFNLSAMKSITCFMSYSNSER